MSAKHQLKHSVLLTLKHNQDGSYNTRGTRKKRLLLVADQLAEGGYKIEHIRQLKFKHVQFLVNRWLQENLSAGTIKNRMTDLRWAMEKFGQTDVIPVNNDDLNIPKRKYVSNQDKSIVLSEGDLSKIIDADVKMSLLLQRAFGLRREESIKIRIHQAVGGDELHLQGSWCKNGRARSIPILSSQQWVVLEQVKQHVGNKQRALIPDHRSYFQQQKIYDRQLGRAGIHRGHGLRHAYAQKRYQELTGFPCPVKGGLLKPQMNDTQKILDLEARQKISLELGHNRAEILSIYLGR